MTRHVPQALQPTQSHKLALVAPIHNLDHEGPWDEGREWHLLTKRERLWTLLCKPTYVPVSLDMKDGTLAMVTCAACLTAYRAEHPEGRQMSLLTEPRP